MRLRKLALVLAVLMGSVSHAETIDYGGKGLMRGAAGVMSNLVRSGDTATIKTALNLGYYHFFFERVALGLGYLVVYDFSSNSVPIHGVDFNTRFYVLGAGTRQIVKNGHDESSFVAPFGIYLGASMTRRWYFLGTNPSEVEGIEVTGSFSNLNALVGAEYRLNERLEVNAEINWSAWSFASSDNRVRLVERVIYFGLGYLF